MSDFVNFKIRCLSDENYSHAYSLFVSVEKGFFSYSNYSYFVKCLVYEYSVPVTLGYPFSTPDEAFEYMERIQKLYPRFGDDRDYDIDFSPEFDLNLIKEPRPSSGTK